MILIITISTQIGGIFLKKLFSDEKAYGGLMFAFTYMLVCYAIAIIYIMCFDPIISPVIELFNSVEGYRFYTPFMQRNMNLTLGSLWRILIIFVMCVATTLNFFLEIFQKWSNSRETSHDYSNEW